MASPDGEASARHVTSHSPTIEGRGTERSSNTGVGHCSLDEKEPGDPRRPEREGATSFERGQDPVRARESAAWCLMPLYPESRLFHRSIAGQERRRPGGIMRNRFAFVAAASALALSAVWLPSATASALPTSVGAGDGPAARPACTITGTNAPDLLRGTPGRDVICAGEGDDRVWGLGGDDLIIGGAGRDLLLGGNGRDLLIGGSGADRIRGGRGADVLRGDGGADALIGGTGRDVLIEDDVQPNDLDYSVKLNAIYGAPLGTTIVWKFIPGSSDCVGPNLGWTDTLSTRQPTHITTIMNRAAYNPLDYCAYHPSAGSWNYQVTTPSGYSRGGIIRVSADQESFSYVRTAVATCTYENPGITCTGGSDTVDGESIQTQTPRPSVTIAID